MDQLATEGVRDVHAMELGAIEGDLDSASDGSVKIGDLKKRYNATFGNVSPFLKT